MTYPIIEVPGGVSSQLEQLGTKAKFWYRDEHDQRWLFKEGRPGTGENWAEKIACEIASLLDIPHARYELATWNGRQGVVTPIMFPKGGALIHGNELLGKIISDYDEFASYRARQHTLRRITAILKLPEIATPIGWQSPPECRSAFDVFAGYLMLDALIGNQDRHHENWALIHRDQKLSLAPTFDHASSLGRNETDGNRLERLTTKDRGRSVATYAQRARSGLYEAPDDRKPMGTVQAFAAALKTANNAGRYWLSRLAQVSVADVAACLEALPERFATDPARRFALEMLKVNRQRLLDLEKPSQ